MVVRDSYDATNIGKFMRLDRLLAPGEEVTSVCGGYTVATMPGYPRWLTDTPLCVGRRGGGRVIVLAAFDSDLRPIRDPGDDAVDETLLRLPAPAAQPVVGLPAAPVEA